ncbi:hypothetical protein RO3G_15365 [Rhizopus delemar RA 99-880]|uniref:Uncharacterized protein n=1 Tax=Rhizopus delemar (strain RA 99-880 / ATCC MYA-4621 / FGSC 9543 / NRRL 43880) TaxID=246409 RepID=I1CQC4_RHIO9|nr:hypothetical protein RO3G_15365 [Rhizopus delemar RA 99-880]|eukprot:EIE90654.1 hypothetical protein RO3G_15365 [Rhizopus delemar RA 99-880]
MLRDSDTPKSHQIYAQKSLCGYYLKARKSKFNLQPGLSKYHVLLQKLMR